MVRGPRKVRGSKKEPNFFNRNYERGYEWYHRLFEFGPWKNAEFSVLYFHDRNVPARIHAYNPEVKLLLSLRNPIDRAFSHHKHEFRRGRLPRDLHTFREALEQNPSYVQQGMYATHLARWLRYFDLRQIHVIVYEDICADPDRVLKDIYEFVGVDSRFEPTQLTARVNVSIAKRSQRLDRALRVSSVPVKTVLGERLSEVVKKTGIPRRVRQYNRVEVDDRHLPPLTECDRSYLASVYAEENAKLGALLDRDFSHWT